MKHTYSLYLDKKGKKNSANKLHNKSTIQKNNIRCESYFIGENPYMKISKEIFENNFHKDSIYGFGFINTSGNFEMDSYDLLEEVTKYGSKLLSKHKKILFDTNFLDLKNIELNKEIVLNTFLQWCKKYGFPVQPQKYSIYNNEIDYYELKYEKIRNLAYQFLVIYLLNTYYKDLMFFLKLDSDKIINIGLEQNVITQLKRIFKFSNLMNISIPELYKEDILEDILKKKNKFMNNILKQIVPVMNEFSSYFTNSSSTYFSFYRNKIYLQFVYNNIFDICWNAISENYNNFSFTTKKCSTCGNTIEIKTDKKYCSKCAKERSNYKENEASKIALIKEMVDFYNNYYIEDEKSEIKNELFKYYSYTKDPHPTGKLKSIGKKYLINLYEEMKLKNSK